MYADYLLREMYIEYDTPCDRLVSNPESLGEFCDDYVARTGDAVAPAELGHHLLNLRRRGQANGGLPRLRRGYSGRGSWRN